MVCTDLAAYCKYKCQHPIVKFIKAENELIE